MVELWYRHHVRNIYLENVCFAHCVLDRRLRSELTGVLVFFPGVPSQVSVSWFLLFALT